jgi:hypothetical protein
VVGGYAVLEVKSKEDAIEAARWLMDFNRGRVGQLRN